MTTRPHTAVCLRQCFDAASDLDLVAHVSGARAAAERVFALRPDVLVVEAADDTVDAMDLTRRVVVRGNATPPAVLLVADGGADGLELALWRGVRGLVFGPGGPHLLAHAVRLVAAGYVVIPPSARCTLDDWSAGGLPADPRHAVLDQLTAREREVFDLVAGGHSNAEISAVLRLSESTVKSYLQRILDKLELRNRAGVVILAYEAGVLRPNRPA